MTQLYDRLKEAPQTGVSRSELNFEERARVRAIQVTGTAGLTQTNNPGKFTDVFYLEGEERAAAETFADVNAELLEQVDFTARNVLQTSLSRELYDLILDAAGNRDITKFPTTVVETHTDGTVWIINRNRYETQVDRRYTTSETGTARVPPTTSPQAIYEQQGQTIAEADLTSTKIEGDVRQVLDYYRVAPAFDCDPVTTADQQLAVQKRPE
ncbi:hypothetical protein [Haloarcula marismortui]|jgi:hypothetical protein|uniref:Uncharacterized protein n=1 Tax=Haloarcula marismortui ATCC 33800 TaxID=662476 RepID=M0K608_9EURY|nr:hypothetical protein [Haloarcula sinaiiensis]EMA16263.1 hypothetical protein C436_00780 [Haloarcula sinaiiensis ATCC 33800]QUJ72829.1 hypothetical protein KDQ40_03490 [Haloarcula sinaiiensis ATCC 33800]